MRKALTEAFEEVADRQTTEPERRYQSSTLLDHIDHIDHSAEQGDRSHTSQTNHLRSIDSLPDSVLRDDLSANGHQQRTNFMFDVDPHDLLIDTCRLQNTDFQCDKGLHLHQHIDDHQPSTDFQRDGGLHTRPSATSVTR